MRDDRKEDIWEMRPGYLFGCVFVWLSFTNSRFLAPFLETEIGMSDATIGACLAVQQAIVTICGSLVGPLADQREALYPERGRAEFLAGGVFFATIFSLLHGLVHVSPFFASPAFHFALRMGYACSFGCVYSMLDAVTIHYLDSHPQMSRDNYGRERLFGAVSWAISHLFYGILLDWVGYTITYPLTLMSTVLALWSIYMYVQHQKARSNIYTKSTSDIVDEDGPQVHDVEPESREQRSRVTEIIKVFFGSYSSVTFMICLLLLSSGQAIVDQLVFLFFETLDSSFTMMACTVVLTVSFEIPIFQVAPLLLEKTGSGVLLLIACFCYIFRVLGYAAIPKGHIAYVLLLEPLHGVTYACSQTSAVATAARFSPKGWEATGQGFMSLIKGCGSVAGLLYGGWAVEYLGGRRMFQISSCLVSIGALCFATSKFHLCIPGSGRMPNTLG